MILFRCSVSSTTRLGADAGALAAESIDIHDKLIGGRPMHVTAQTVIVMLLIIYLFKMQHYTVVT